MQYEDRIICFIDILGFREHVRQSTEPTSPGGGMCPQALLTALEEMRNSFNGYQDELPAGITRTQFSDSIVVSFPIDQKSGVFYTLSDVLHLQMILATNGFLCRGSVVRGMVIHTAEVLVGPGLIHAHDLESKVAIYPRIIVESPVVEAGTAAHAAHHSAAHEEQYIKEMLKRDFDGQHYIDYIGAAQQQLGDGELEYPSYLEELVELAKSTPPSDDPSIESKKGWLRDKLRSQIAAVKRNAVSRLSEDEELRDSYLSLPDLP
jgi:hypothetical protein